jgi:chaperonin GroES
MDAPTPATEGPDLQHPDRVTVEKLQLLHDYLVVRPLAVPSKKGRFHMPETASERERSHRGVVLAIGPGDFNEPGTARVPMSIRVDDLVFFGKFSGTEEEVGGHTVLVMRESECRMSVAAGAYRIVSHEDARFDHLVEDWCEICHGIPLEQAAREQLALEREQLLVGKRPGLDAPPDAAELQRQALDLLGTWEPTVEGVNEMIGEINQTRGVTPLPIVVTAVLEDRRPCAGEGFGPCLFMQRKYQTAHGPIWLGLRCGHWHRAVVIEP